MWRIIVFGTCGSAKAADVSLKIRSTCLRRQLRVCATSPSGSLAIFAAVRRASSRVGSLALMSALPAKADLRVPFGSGADILKTSANKKPCFSANVAGSNFSLRHEWARDYSRVSAGSPRSRALVLVYNVPNSLHAGAIANPTKGIDTAPINRPTSPEITVTTVHFTAPAANGSA